MTLRALVVSVLAAAGLLYGASVFGAGIDTTSPNYFAWGENIGWLNWGSSEGDVDVPDPAGDLTGYVWGENVGWLSLNCSNTSSCGTVDYKVTRGGGQFTGYAWGENVGWVSFSCLNTSSCGTVDYRVSIATSSGEFSGYAWGENIGWVVFNCSTTGSCGTVDYRVRTETPTPTPTPSSGGSSTGGYYSPSPGASPGVSVPPTASPTSPPPGTPLPTPSGAPSLTPPPFTPPASPPVTASPQPTDGPFPAVVGQLSDLLDRLARALFGRGGEDTRQCEGAVGIAACGATALAVASVAIALVAGLIQGELWPTMLAMLQIVGLRRKPHVWGVVYDSSTKRPIASAKVELIDASGRVIEVRFADQDGRYGFLASPQSLGVQQLTVSMRVTKPGYQFPSALLVSGTDYVVYDRLYRGGQVTITQSEFLGFNIPLDPISGARVSMTGLGRGLVGAAGDRVLAVGFVVGCIAVPLNVWLNPTPFSWGVAVLFVVANVIRSAALYRPYGKTVNALTGKPLPFALVTMNDPVTGARSGFAVSDEHGRFILSGVKGADYDLVAYTPANISPQRSVRRRVRASSRIGRRGWVTMTLSL